MQKNRHHLSTLIFVSSFATDLFVLTELNLSQVQVLFSGYLIIALVASLVHHALAHKVEDQEARPFIKIVSFASEFLAQFFIGGLLSGFLIFYTVSGSLYTSWPFIALLALIFLGNEFLRSVRSHLAFQTLLLFIATYGFLNAAVPIWFGTITVKLFLLSSAVSIGLLGVYLLVLWYIDSARLRAVFASTLASCALFTGLFMFYYFSHLIPPVPLTLKEGGMYQSVTHLPTGEYQLVGQHKKPWWDVYAPNIYIGDGTNSELSAYTSVFAPTAFTTSIEHEWARYDNASRSWKTQAVIAFTVNGGRQTGYRGYTTKTNITPGYWRVVVKTLSGQVIGTIRFNAVSGVVPPDQVVETLR
jgi:hypothetical protein